MSKTSDVDAKGPQRLIEIANNNEEDRFGILDCPTLPEPYLDVPIHPIFRPENFANVSPVAYQNARRVLGLASSFLHYDSVLEWFVRPLFGLPMVDTRTWKTYYSDPLTGKNEVEKAFLISRVREALQCLSHSIHFCFVDTNGMKFFARTLMHRQKPLHHPFCTNAFRHARCVKVEIKKEYRVFLENDYTSCTLAERLRFDFFLAYTLVHEIAHCMGIMRRGDLIEPHIRLNDPEQTEFGYSWEDFVFGGIINPFDRASSRISFLMMKIWANDEEAQAAGGKEYFSVPMQYIAQWFKRSTWRTVAEEGPSAIPPPTVRVRLRATKTEFMILTDNKDALRDLATVKQMFRERYKGTRSEAQAASVRAVLQCRLRYVDHATLQKNLIVSPSRRAMMKLKDKEEEKTPKLVIHDSLLTGPAPLVVKQVKQKTTAAKVSDLRPNKSATVPMGITVVKSNSKTTAMATTALKREASSEPSADATETKESHPSKKAKTCPCESGF